jgi:hypothetical protein
LLAALPWFGGCSGSDDSKTQPGEAAMGSVTAQAQYRVLARVDGTPITEIELNQAMERFFADQSQIRNREQVEGRIVQSLIDSRAISRLAEAELDGDARQMLDVKVAAYREELLVKSYLADHADPHPVTSDMVEEYYRTHRDEFGGGTAKRFEIVQTTRSLKDDERKTLIQLLGKLSSEKDWHRWADSHKSLPIGWREVTAKVEVLMQPLKSLVAGTEQGETSPLHMDDQLTIVRVKETKVLAAKPLSEVSAEIRRKLAPLKMKEAIKTISEAAKKQVKVELFEKGG